MKLRALFILAFISTIQNISAQTPELNASKWAAELNKRGQDGNDSLIRISTILQHVDSAKAFLFLDQLEKNGGSKGDRFRVRFNCLKATTIYYWLAYYQFYQDRKPVDRELVKKQLTQLYSSAIDLAYRSEDDYLVAYASTNYAAVINNLGETGIAVMYAKNGVDLYEKLGVPVQASSYQFLAELLYKVREYDECIKYATKAVEAWRGSPKEYKPFTVSCMNTVALGYHRKKIYDSAFVHYNQALQLAKSIKDTVWIGIVSGNMGQIFYALGKYDTAYTLLTMDYRASKNKGYFDNAANSLQWAARANLARGNKASALAEVREAFQLLGVWPDPTYLRNTYYTTTQIFKEMGSYDSAFHYNNLYSVLNDSLEKVVATSSLAISQARLNDETSRYNIQNLNKQKRSELLLRNIIIASLVVLCIIGLLVVNRERLKEKIKTEKAELDKLRMEQEIISAKQQLKMFTENIIEKTNRIEKLESEIKGKDASSDQQIIISELSRQTILTEDDWLKFKNLFEKTHPGFFIKLKEQANDITLAEQRMAALTRLRLTTKQMAAVLGISSNSVIKAKQRLRQRFNFQTDFHVEEFLSKI